jgi:uroporphyrinogen-III synthase
MTPLIVIRPQPGCDSTVTAAREMGLEAEGFPLFEVRPLPWEAPDPDEVDAVLFGSTNALRHGGAALAVLFGKPAYAVGEATAEAARLAGFDVVETGQGSIQDLLGRLWPDHKRLLRPAGQKRVELTPPEGVTIDERAVYMSEPVEMPGALRAKLPEPAIVALHSGEAARHFADCCERNGIDRSRIAIVAISQRAAEMAGEGWQEVRVALNPDDRALLAMAKQMCQEPGNDKDNKAGSMQDQTTSEAFQPAYAPRKRRFRGPLLLALLAFALGAAVIGWFAANGYFAAAPGLGQEQVRATEAPLESGEGRPPAPGVAIAPPSAEEQLKAVTTVEGRLAMLEDRLSRLDLQADAASGNVARAEGLLIAFATRRMIDRGEPLRYLSDQLRLRFANAQPRAVETIIEFSKSPVTMDELTARLEALAPQLTKGESEESLWTSFTRELRQMFVIRRDSSSVMTPQARIERARMMLTARRIPEAIEQVELLPGAEAADKWIIDARRFAEVQAALDLIETAAMLEPRKLKDSEGKRIDQPSPIATPVETKPADMKQN